MENVKGPDILRDQALIQMVNEYQGTLLRLCYVILHDEEQAKDAVQETFLRAYKGWSNFRGASSEKTWLMRIAVNLCRDTQRGGWFRHVDKRVTPEDLPASSMMAEQEDLDVMCAVMELPPKLREVVTLYYWQEMNLHEIGQALNIAPSTASIRLKQARGKLSKTLEGRYSRGRAQRKANDPTSI